LTKISAVVVTRGDVDLEQIVESIPCGWEIVVWNNGLGACDVHGHGATGRTSERYNGSDLSVYGRYEAIKHATGEVIFVQDDDCVVSDPEALLDAWLPATWNRSDHAVCNMPQEFRHDGYTEHSLVGFGAVFHRDAPKRAFTMFERWRATRSPEENARIDAIYNDTCDIVFTALTPCVFLDIPKVNLEWATGGDRMYQQPDHGRIRAQMLSWVRQARDDR
jgi:hypothetical protein